MVEYNNGYFSMYFDKTGFSDQSTSVLPLKENYSVYFDTNLWSLMYGFPNVLSKDTQYKLGDANQYNYARIQIKQQITNVIVNAGTTYIKVNQNIDSVSGWNSALSVLFSSDSINFYPEIDGEQIKITNTGIAGADTETNKREITWNSRHQTVSSH
jgi:hypothetical protein